MNCPDCHKRLPEGTDLCPFCGKAIPQNKKSALAESPAASPLKRLLWIGLAVILVFVGLTAWVMSGKPGSESGSGIQELGMTAPSDSAVNAFPAVTATPDPGETAAAAPVLRVDMEALHDRYPEDMVYATVGTREITWGEYYEWLGSTVLSAEDYMDMTSAYYGTSLGWDSDYAEGLSLADYVVASLSDNFRAYTGIDLFAEARGIRVSEEELAAKKAEDRSATLGPDATDEDWAALLTQNYMTERLYEAQARANLELTKTLDAFYGENGEKISVADLQRYIEDKEYLRCNHILFLTMDMSTRETLDEETVAAKKAQAEEIAAELQAIEGREELLSRFAELKTELDEDSGKLYYPEGYLFTPGTMVAIFEDTTRALHDYEVSDPVLSDYGYHVIIRLPIDASTQTDDGKTIGAAAASELMAADLDEIVDALDFTLAPGAEPVNLLDFLAEPATK